MKFLTQMKACDVVTVKDGQIQAIKGPLAFLGYMAHFKDMQFAVDAEMFVAAVRKMKTSFHVRQEGSKIKLFNGTQEVDFEVLSPEIMLNSDVPVWVEASDFLKAWNLINKLVHTEFPGIRIEEGYLEALSQESVVRVYTDTLGIRGIFSAGKVLTGCTRVAFFNNRLWFGEGDTDRMVLNYLDVDFPSTEQYFGDSFPRDGLVPLPQKLADKFVVTDTVVFKDGCLQLIKGDRATVSIENVAGSGQYNSKLFKHVLEHSKLWYFASDKMFFQGPTLKGVLAHAGD